MVYQIMVPFSDLSRHLAEMYCLGELGLEINLEAAEEFLSFGSWMSMGPHTIAAFHSYGDTTIAGWFCFVENIGKSYEPG